MLNFFLKLHWSRLYFYEWLMKLRWLWLTQRKLPRNFQHRKGLMSFYLFWQKINFLYNYLFIFFTVLSDGWKTETGEAELGGWCPGSHCFCYPPQKKDKANCGNFSLPKNKSSIQSPWPPSAQENLSQSRQQGTSIDLTTVCTLWALNWL